MDPYFTTYIYIYTMNLCQRYRQIYTIPMDPMGLIPSRKTLRLKQLATLPLINSCSLVLSIKERGVSFFCVFILGNIHQASPYVHFLFEGGVQ